jgi:MarR family transcriptional regulator, organic hydroperoxide resistance regulator
LLSKLYIDKLTSRSMISLPKISILTNTMNDTQQLEDWELLAQICQAYRTLSDNFMDQIDLHRAQATVLCKLFRQDGVTQSEIAQQLSVQGATVTDMLQRMEEAGLVNRRRDPDDNRLVRVYLTEAGREKERGVIAQLSRLEDVIFEGIDDNQRTLARGLLKQMLYNMTVNV